jgi:hypothetical protein
VRPGLLKPSWVEQTQGSDGIYEDFFRIHLHDGAIVKVSVEVEKDAD